MMGEATCRCLTTMRALSMMGTLAMMGKMTTRTMRALTLLGETHKHDR